MEYTFFYISTIIIWISFFISIRFKPLKLTNIIIGITSIAYSLSYEILLGEYFNLYYYIKPEKSALYIFLAGIFIYPLLNIIYTLFLPKKTKNILIYTIFWIITMLIFEYSSLLTKTVVLIRWRVFPWSILTYVLTYLWVFLAYRYLEQKIN